MFKKRTKSSLTTNELSKFKFLFSSIYSHKEIGLAFQKHLKSEANTEPLDFLFDIQGVKDDPETVCDLIDLYIRVDSSKELNIAGKCRKPLMDVYEKLKGAKTWPLEVSAQYLFAEVQKSVTMTLTLDSFPRFTHTMEAEEIFVNYLEDSTVCIPNLASDKIYTDENFFETEISAHLKEEDILFMKELLADSFAWKLIHLEKNKEKSMNIFISTVNYFPKVSFFSTEATVMTKWDLVVPYNYIDLCKQVTRDSRVDGMLMRVQCKELDVMRLFGNVIATATKMEVDMRLPFPLITPRKFFFTATAWHDQENECIYWINKPCIPEQCQYLTMDEKRKFKYTGERGVEPTEKDCLMFYSYQVVIYQKLDENLTSYRQVHATTFNGWSNIPFFQENFLIQRGKELQKIAEYAMATAEPDDVLRKSIGLGRVALSFSTNRDMKDNPLVPQSRRREKDIKLFPRDLFGGIVDNDIEDEEDLE